MGNTLTIQFIEHRNEVRTFLFCHYDTHLVNFIKDKLQAKWSQTQMSFYISNDRNLIKQVWDYAKSHQLAVEFKNKPSDVIIEPPPEPVNESIPCLSEEALAKIMEYKFWLKSRFYNDSTINTYSEALKVFLTHAKNTVWHSARLLQNRSLREGHLFSLCKCLINNLILDKFVLLFRGDNSKITIKSNILKLSEIKIQKLETVRLILIPYTIEICENVLLENYDLLYNKGYKKGKSWPDEDVIDTIPRVIKNLLKNNYATGLESWLIIKKDTKEIIGDVGFKGYNFDSQNVDLGYGIISEERRKGYAEEASRELINWVLKLDYIKEITANCSAENFQSINLLNKLAFHQLKVNENMIYWSLKNTF